MLPTGSPGWQPAILNGPLDRRVCAATQSPLSKRIALEMPPDAASKAPNTDHDRVAVTIETVISRYGLGMLLQQLRGF
jgi:hypothetical protein